MPAKHVRGFERNIYIVPFLLLKAKVVLFSGIDGL
jgi:hypothetical protein